MIKRFHKYYHPKNKNFFIHITVDVILILSVISAMAYTLYLMAHPVQYPLISNSIIIPKPNETIAAQRQSEDIAKKKIMNELKLSAICRYSLSEGDQLGLGPLPPQVGEITNYWIFLSPSTDHFDLRDVLITADLPANVSFTGQTSAVSEAGVAYDESNRQISWKVSKLTDGSDGLIPPGAAFEIALTPTENQIGSIAKLLVNIKISGLDIPTKTPVSAMVPDLTTKIKEDMSGGVVQP